MIDFCVEERDFVKERRFLAISSHKNMNLKSLTIAISAEVVVDVLS